MSSINFITYINFIITLIGIGYAKKLSVEIIVNLDQ